MPSRVAVLLPQRVGTQRLPQGELVLAASLETPALLLKWVSDSVGQWRLTADTSNRQIFFRGHWKRAKSFPGCPSGHVLCLYQTQSFPKPCCLDVSFHFSVFCCRRVEGEQLRAAIFLVRDSLKKLVPWATAIAFHILLRHLFDNISTQTDPLLGPLTCSWSSLQPKGCSHVAVLTIPTQSQPPEQFHLLQYVYELKKAQLQVGDGLSSALYTVTSLWKGSPLGQARNCTKVWSVQCCPQAPCASWQLHSTCKQPHQPCGPCSVLINELKKLSVHGQSVLKGTCCVRWSLMSYLPGTNGNVAAVNG